ncbi:hypothetical protein B0O80DRAFT_501893 [Mortierella sp. GBAus27b]|nr:hypothetical protein BGX31_005345 [Mortierella sp. GBA43]KAI8348524.1 hypothetical protein B0O80DRAFT_501893 [Mortierella sp. GBAus27b]
MADPTQNTDASVSTFVSSAIFTTAVSAALFLAFGIVRPRFPRVYAPRGYIGPEHERPHHSAQGLLGWITGSRRHTEAEFIELCGLDAFMFLEFLNKSLYLFSGFAILSLPVLIPLNVTNQLNLEGLNQLTIANIATQQRLWAHLVLTVLFCAATIALGIYCIRQYIIRRQNYLMSEQHAQSLQATTILVCGIPRGEDNLQELYHIFGAFPGGVKRIWLAYAAPDLEKEVANRVALTAKLEASECSLISAKLKHHLKNGRRGSYSSTKSLSNDTGDQEQRRQTANSDESFPSEFRPQHRPATFPMSLIASCRGIQKVDSIQTYRADLSNMNASIVAKQQAAMTAMRDNSDKDKMRAAFIQFNHQLGAHLATQSVIHRRILTMGPRHLEVHPKDVLWDNLNLGLKTRNIRRVISMALATVLIVFWSIPVAFMASIAKLDAIVRFAPFLSGVYELPKVVVGIIQGLLPPIGLAVLMALIPIILYGLSHFGGEVLSTRKTLDVITSYHWFSVVHVLLVTTLANGIFAAVQAIKDNPNNIMTMLSSTLPQASTFFLSFILLSLIQIPMMLLQIGPLIIYFITKKLSKTPRQMFAAETTMGCVDWGMTIPVHTIAFSIGLLYSTIQPLILPLMIIYFGLYYMAFRYMFLYVYRQPYDSGGLIFPRIVDQMYIAVILFEIVMLGLFILQKAVGESIVMFILLVASIAAIVISRNKVFKPLIQYLPVGAFDTRGIAAAMSGNSIVAGPGADTADVLEKLNPIASQEEFHEKAPHKDSSSPPLESGTKEVYSPDSSKQDATMKAPSIRVESVTVQPPAPAVPSTSTSPVTTTPHGLLVRQDSSDGGLGASSSLQVLGANHSLTSSSDPPAEKIVSDTLTYVNPAFWKQCLPIWLPKDPRGFAEVEAVELTNAGLPCTTDSATMDAKGHVTVETSQRSVAPGEEHWE